MPDPMVPQWLHVLAMAWLLLGAVCAMAICLDVIRHPQQMWIMNVVWPVVALFGTIVAVYGYFAYGRLATRRLAQRAKAEGSGPLAKTGTPFPVMVAKGASHCGSGCTLGDICAEWLAFAFPSITVWFGWHTIFSEKMFAVWMLDYLLAFILGISFQYFTIVPMRGLGPWRGLWQAVKADTLSLTAWQIGM